MTPPPPILPYPTPWDIDMKKNLNVLECKDTSIRVTDLLQVKIYTRSSYVKIRPPPQMWPHPTFGDLDFSKYESTLHANASTQAFLAD